MDLKKIEDMDWFTDDVKSSANKKTKLSGVDQILGKKEKDGYIDFFTSNKVYGTLRSCAQDAIINIARIFNIDIKDKIYTSFLPKKTKIQHGSRLSGRQP